MAHLLKPPLYQASIIVVVYVIICVVLSLRNDKPTRNIEGVV